MNIDLERIKSDNIPVIILSSLRVGSTWVAQYISNALSYRYFHEVCKNPRKQREFYTFAAQDKKYVLKEHGFLFAQRYPESFINQPSYKIRLRRKDLFKQVLSYYVAFTRDKFIYHKVNKDLYFGETIALDEKILLENYQEVVQYNQGLESFQTNVDLDLYYEDLDLPYDEIIPATKPVNNAELTAWAYNILKDKL